MLSNPAVTASSRHFTASAVVFDVAKRLVLLVDHKASGYRQFPGGHIDENEAGHEAALREVAEETGVRATLWAEPLPPVPGSVWLPNPFRTAECVAPAKPHKNELAHRHIDLLYLATASSADPVTARLAEVYGAVWRPVDDLGANVRADVPPVVADAWKDITGQAI